MSYYPSYITEDRESSVENIQSLFTMKSIPFRVWDSSGTLISSSVPLPTCLEGKDDQGRHLLVDFGNNIYIDGDLVIFFSEDKQYRQKN